MPTCRTLVVDDYEPFRRVLCSILRERKNLQVIGEASDGLEAVQKAKELQPDLILLDISLPKLNGIQVAKRLRDLVLQAKILFVSVESSADVVREALNMGGSGYVHKSHVGSELLPAIETVLGGKQFVGNGLEDEFSDSTTVQAHPRHHEALFYSDDAVLLESVTHFIVAALKAGNASVVLATKPHRRSLFQALKAQGVDVDAAIQQGAYVAVDAAETLSKFMTNRLPDAGRFNYVTGEIISRPAQAVAGIQRARVTVFGEMVALLYAGGNMDAVIRLEKLWNMLVETHNVDLLCGYPLNSFNGEKDESFKSICSEHSVVYSL